jgi:hypothetical protein
LPKSWSFYWLFNKRYLIQNITFLKQRPSLGGNPKLGHATEMMRGRISLQQNVAEFGTLCASDDFFW